MTSKELYQLLKPDVQETIQAQLLSDGLNANVSSFYTRLIKDAARCNKYSCDVFYDIEGIEKALRNYKPGNEFKPIWIGFRKYGVDGTAYVVSHAEDGLHILHREYFALYSMNIESFDSGWANIVINEYWM